MPRRFANEAAFRNEFPISFRLRITEGAKKLHPDIYDTLFSEFTKRWGFKPDEITFLGQARPAFYLEIAEKDSTGAEIGTRVALIRNETGPDVLFCLPDVIGGVPSDLIAMGVGWLLSEASRLYRARTRVHVFEYLDIRSPKGNLRLKLTDFELGSWDTESDSRLGSGLKCLISNWNSLRRLEDANAPCFDGRLIEIPS